MVGFTDGEQLERVFKKVTCINSMESMSHLSTVSACVMRCAPPNDSVQVPRLHTSPNHSVSLPELYCVQVDQDKNGTLDFAEFLMLVFIFTMENVGTPSGVQ